MCMRMRASAAYPISFVFTDICFDYWSQLFRRKVPVKAVFDAMFSSLLIVSVVRECVSVKLRSVLCPIGVYALIRAGSVPSVPVRGLSIREALRIGVHTSTLSEAVVQVCSGSPG